MTDEEKIIRVNTFEDFDRELGRGGEETLEVPAWIAEQYSLFPEDAGRRARRSGAEGGSGKALGPAWRGERTGVRVASSQDHVQIIWGSPVLR